MDRPAEPDGGGYFQAASADLNDDGLLDLVVGRFHNVVDGGPGRIEVFLGLPDGGLAAPSHFDGSDGWTVVVADLDGDGLADVATSNFGRMSVFLNLGDGRLGPPTSFEFPTFQLGLGIGSPFIGAGDVNGDGRADLAVAQWGNAYLLLGRGGGEFESPRLILRDSGQGEDHSATYRGVKVVDLNGDGLGDLALSSNTGTTTVLLSLRDGGFETSVYGGDDFPWVTYGMAAIGRAGAPDLVYGFEAYMRQWSIVVLKNDGTGHFTDGGVTPTPTEPRWFVVADLNGDCLPDLVTSGVTYGWYRNTPVPGASVSYGLVGGGFQPPALLLDADGAISVAPLGPLGRTRALGFVHGDTGVISVLGDSSKH